MVINTWFPPMQPLKIYNVFPLFYNSIAPSLSSEMSVKSKKLPLKIPLKFVSLPIDFRKAAHCTHNCIEHALFFLSFIFSIF